MGLSIKKQIPIYILIGINVLLFILGFFAFDESAYMMNSRTVFTDKQFYRVLTSMFLHADIRHLAFNMISLYGLSGLMLLTQPVWKYYTIYLFSGLLGGLSDAAVRLSMNDQTFTLGASGAVMGLLGANIAFYVKNRRLLPKPVLKSQLLRLGIFAAINLIPENRSVDYFAHLFGFTAGFLLGLAMIKKGG